MWVVVVTDKPEQRTDPDSNVTRLEDARGRTRRRDPKRPRPAATARGVDGELAAGETGYEFTLDLASSVNLPDEQDRLSADDVLARLETTRLAGGRERGDDTAAESAPRPGGGEAAQDREAGAADRILEAISTHHLRTETAPQPREPRGTAELALDTPTDRRARSLARGRRARTRVSRVRLPRLRPQPQQGPHHVAARSRRLPALAGQPLAAGVVLVLALVVVTASVLTLGAGNGPGPSARRVSNGHLTQRSVSASGGARGSSRARSHRATASHSQAGSRSRRLAPQHTTPHAPGRVAGRPTVSENTSAGHAGSPKQGASSRPSGTHGVRKSVGVSSTQLASTHEPAATTTPVSQSPSGAAEAGGACAGAGVLAPTDCGKPSL